MTPCTYLPTYLPTYLQERRLSGEGGNWSNAYYLPTKADLFIAQFRRWLDLYGGRYVSM